MTLTESRPEEAVAEEPVSAPVPESPLTTSDHKRIGRYYVVTALAFVLISAVVGVLLEIELSAKGIQIVGGGYDRLLALHGTAGAVLFLPGLWIGLATYLVPLQIGSRRLAFPRLAALAFWGYFGGGALLLGSYAVGRPVGLGILSSSPLPVTPRGGHATELWAASLILITLSSVIAAANLFVTVVKLRVDGMTMLRLPAFSWSVLAVSAATLLAGPMFVAGMILVYLDQRFGGGALLATSHGNPIWQHLVWLYGRPDVYLVAVPCLGALCDVVATHARRPLVDARAAKGLIFAAAIFSFAIVTADATIARAALLPTPSILSVAVGIPVGLCALLWLGSVRPQQLHLHVSLLYVVGFLLFLVAAAANAAIAPSQHLAGGAAASEWTVGQIHAVLFAAPTLALFGALYHWAPKIWGKGLNQLIGVLQWLLLVAGFGATCLGAWLAGYDGAPWHVDNYTQAKADHYFNYAKLSAAGGVLVGLGLLVFLANAAMAWRSAAKTPAGERAADPYDGATLEWATASPPPPENFDVVPDVRSDAPLTDHRAAVAGR
ncbi:MAG: cytochrome c oxidase subunit I [Acidimicrobiales bacterium]